MEHHSENSTDLGDSLMELHVSVVKLIGAIQGISHTLEEKDKILNMLPLLDFYNDDLLRNINKIRGQQD